ncbi:MAG TPA: PP2C family serine/threonine-protein phosphatase [Ktedonobacterales bacterium]|nr:PP2C family serine/threonine-protein phosphatase [Ktedonobacterales bacterium]
MSLHLTAACKTDVGQQREENEDACYTHVVAQEDRTGAILVVADGMGGYHAGEIASKIAADAIGAALQNLLAPTSSQPTIRLHKKKGRAAKAEARQESSRVTRPLAEDAEAAASAAAGDESASPASANGAEQTPPAAETRPLSEAVVMEHYTEKLREAIEEASDKIVQYGKEHPEARGLGSTVTAALVVGDQAFIANVGDSRTYLLRGDALTRVTTDHSLVERLVEAGQIEREDVYEHPHRNLIYRSLGGTTRAEVDVDIFVERLRPGDALLLCSDGLWEMVRDEQLASILTEVTDPAAACDLLIERANENGGEDNITAVVLRCGEA